ncbi:hypothetical protein [Macrococcus bovicus]|nr:hypothetical protein [Macrococcus bovicus]WJP96693.1 hypothetical protein QSV55_00020 [Macrococcus bovicus]
MKNKNPENKKLFSELEEGMSELILHAENKKNLRTSIVSSEKVLEKIKK